MPAVHVTTAGEPNVCVPASWPPVRSNRLPLKIPLSVSVPPPFLISDAAAVPLMLPAKLLLADDATVSFPPAPSLIADAADPVSEPMV